MLCENCHEREATIFYTEIMNGIKSEHSICSECAKELDFGDDLPFAELLAGILSAYAGVEYDHKPDDSMEQIVCPTCRMSYRDFIKQGVFGCEECYNVFEPLIRDNIRKIQGHHLHTGKRPRYHNEQTVVEDAIKEPLNAEDEIEILREHLKEALKVEDYEEAAKLRDQVRAIQERNGINA